MANRPLPESFDEMVLRFPILDVVIKNLSCTDSDKKLLRDLFLEVYCIAYGDGERSR